MDRSLMALFENIPVGAMISDVSPLPSDPNLRRVRVGRRTVATLRAADIEQLRLETGAEWTAAMAARVGRLMALDRARKWALTLLGRRAYSFAEIRDRLIAKGHDRTVATMIGQELVQSGWINDRILADAVIHQTTRTKPAGARLIKQKLAARKIHPRLIEQSLSQRSDIGQAASEALDFAKARLRRMTALPNRTIQRRLTGALTRRGFDDDTICTVLERLQLSTIDSD